MANKAVVGIVVKLRDTSRRGIEALRKQLQSLGSAAQDATQRMKPAMEGVVSFTQRVAQAFRSLADRVRSSSKSQAQSVQQVTQATVAAAKAQLEASSKVMQGLKSELAAREAALRQAKEDQRLVTALLKDKQAAERAGIKTAQDAALAEAAAQKHVLTAIQGVQETKRKIASEDVALGNQALAQVQAQVASQKGSLKSQTQAVKAASTAQANSWRNLWGVWNQTTKNMQRSAAQTGRSTRTMSSTMGGAFRSIGRYARAAGTAIDRFRRSVLGATTAARLARLASALGFGLLVRSVTQASSKVEDLRLRMDSLFRSAAEGRRAMGWMTKFATTVPFTLESIMEAGTILSVVMRNGVKDLKQMAPIMTDLAAVSGLTLREVASQLVRMFSAGAAAADLFRERGVIAMLGFQFGVRYSTEETRQQLLRAYNDQASAFRGASLRMAKTWNGLISMMQDRWFLFRVAIGQTGLYDGLKASLREIIRLIDDAMRTGSFQRFAGMIGEAIQFIIDKTLWGVRTLLSLLPRIVSGLHWVMQLPSTVVRNLKVAQLKLDNLWDKLVMALAGWGDSFLGVLRDIITYDLKETLLSAWDKLTEVLAAVFNKLPMVKIEPPEPHTPEEKPDRYGVAPTTLRDLVGNMTGPDGRTRREEIQQRDTMIAELRAQGNAARELRDQMAENSPIVRVLNALIGSIDVLRGALTNPPRQVPGQEDLADLLNRQLRLQQNLNTLTERYQSAAGRAEVMGRSGFVYGRTALPPQGLQVRTTEEAARALVATMTPEQKEMYARAWANLLSTTQMQIDDLLVTWFAERLDGLQKQLAPQIQTLPDILGRTKRITAAGIELTPHGQPILVPEPGESMQDARWRSLTEIEKQQERERLKRGTETLGPAAIAGAMGTPDVFTGLEMGSAEWTEAMGVRLDELAEKSREMWQQIQNYDAMEQFKEKMKQTFQDIITNGIERLGDSIGQAFEDMVMGAKSFGQALGSAMLGSLADVARYFGDYFTAIGLASIGMGLIPGFQGASAGTPWMFAAAAAMYALSGVLGGLANKAGGGGATSSTSTSEGVAARGEVTIVFQDGFVNLSDPRQRKQMTDMIQTLTQTNAKVVVRGA